ncbi:MAG: acyl-CoA dehydrogenase [Hyphomonadaceae bacterium]
MSLILSRRDQDFVLYEWLDVESLTGRPLYAHHDKQTFDAILDMSEKMATDLFANHFKLSDQNEPHFDGDVVHIIPEEKIATDALFASGLPAASQTSNVGGMHLPITVEQAAFAWFNAANGPTSGYAFLTKAAANLLLEHGSPEQVERYARPMLQGRFFGTMCLSEPDTGSSLSDIRTRAEPQPDGTYRLFGNKMWISGGEHPLSETIIHLVLAKVPGGPPGVKGISLFIVPRDFVNEDGSVGERNDVALAGLNHKMGNRGTTNTLLNFGEGAKAKPGGKAGAVGYLVGQLHNGLAGMFTMMNEARISVGTGAACLGYTGYLQSLEYARTRLQGRPPHEKDPTTPQVPLVRHADIRRMLLAQKAYAEGAMALNLYAAKILDEARSSEDEAERADLLALLDLLTPICKSWPSQFCLEGNSLAIQVHGGYGYTRDFNVEQLYRDNRLNPIHEGTHGIQSIDLLGRKVVAGRGRSMKLLQERMNATCAKAQKSPALKSYAQTLTSLFDRVTEVTNIIHAEANAEKRLANSAAYLEAFGHMVIAWIWLDKLCVAEGKTGSFYDGKRAAARYFFTWEVPKTGPQLDLLASLDTTLLDLDPASL